VNARMTEVTHVPTSAYNVFSATKRLTKGWRMHGDAEMIC
jgi:hypothetical protein